MSGNNSGAQKSARARLEELRQQILDAEEAAQCHAWYMIHTMTDIQIRSDRE